MQLKSYIHTLLRDVKDKTRLQFYIEKTKAITGQLDVISEQRQASTDYSPSKRQIRKLTFEELYLKSILSDDTIVFNPEHSLEYFKTPSIIKIIDIIKGESPIVTKLLHKKLDESDQALIEDIILQKSLVSHEDTDSIYTRIKETFLKERIAEIGARLAIAENIKDNELIDQLFKEKNELMSKLRALKK